MYSLGSAKTAVLDFLLWAWYLMTEGTETLPVPQTGGGYGTSLEVGSPYPGGIRVYKHTVFS